jgi:hypothetical protein
MKIPDSLARAFLGLDQFAARNWRKFVLVGSGILILLTLRTCYEAGRYQAAVQANPPLRKKQARALVAQSKRDSVVAVKYKAIARKATVQKDSALTIARTITAQADSIHAEISALPTTVGGPLSAVQKRLANYQAPDTTGF